jgi:type IV pilus assembly protein PilW
MAMKRTFILRGGSRARALGFSLVELMVASAVGLIVTLAVTGSVLTMGRQFSIVGSNVSAQGSAQIALSLIDAAARGAGAGFYNNGRLICPTWNAWNGTTVISNGAAMMPARIVAGASNTAPDTIVFTGASGGGALSALPVVSDAAPGASVKISNGATLADGDLAVIGVPGSALLPCTLFQVTNSQVVVGPGACGGNATSCRNLVRTPNSGLNPNPTTFTTDPTFGFTTAGATQGPAVVSRVGSSATGFRQDAFAVQCNSLVRFNAFANPTIPACTASPLGFGAGVDAIATDVVMVQAQYGVSASAASDVVTQWVEPTGATWGTTATTGPTTANVARIKAVRLVLVARSKEAEAAQVSAPCTNANGVANTGPCSFQDAAAPVIDLSATTVAAGKSWRNYRYRVHQAVIPLRNVIWSDS